MHLQDLPPDARPREKLLARGAGALADAELLALLLRTGIRGKGVLQMADELLNIKNDSCSSSIDGGFDGISGLLHATADDLKRVKGLGPAKRAELIAVLFLDAQNRLLAMEELFRGTLTQLSVTLLRKYFGWFRRFTATQSESQLCRGLLCAHC